MPKYIWITEYPDGDNYRAYLISGGYYSKLDALVAAYAGKVVRYRIEPEGYIRDPEPEYKLPENLEVWAWFERETGEFCGIENMKTRRDHPTKVSFPVNISIK